MGWVRVAPFGAQCAAGPRPLRLKPRRAQWCKRHAAAPRFTLTATAAGFPVRVIAIALCTAVDAWQKKEINA